jgi:hypothetical protein
VNLIERELDIITSWTFISTRNTDEFQRLAGIISGQYSWKSFVASLPMSPTVS